MIDASHALADLERAHALLGLAIVQIRHDAASPGQWVQAVRGFQHHATRALDSLNEITRAATSMDRTATAPAGRA